MLQQTQVKTVIPYWERWMKTLPTIRALARATPEKIHKLWEGLGYYTRVRNMHQAARETMTRHNGKFPETYEEILALPGIGRYTAGAICSIAFNQPTPVLDGNVIRVLTRVFAIPENPRDKSTNNHLWQLAEQLVSQAANLNSAPKIPGRGNNDRSADTLPPDGRSPPLPGGEGRGEGKRKCETIQQPSARRNLDGEIAANTPSTISSFSHQPPACSHLNQSLMELGALICTPKQPACLACPARSHCAAHRRGLVDQLPNLGPQVPATARRFVAFVCENEGNFLVRQRPPGVVNAHLWEFPNVEIAPDPNEGVATARRHKKFPNFEASSDANIVGRVPPHGVRLNKLEIATIKRAATKVLGNIPDSLTKLRTIKHSITRYRITLDVFKVSSRTPSLHHSITPTFRSSTLPHAWLPLKKLNRLAFAGAHRKILQHLATNSGTVRVLPSQHLRNQKYQDRSAKTSTQ